MKVTTDLSVTSLRPRQSGIWTPSLLFDGGEQGAWFDPSDLSTLFQDAAGTIPVTADGDQVGLILDKSGNGNHTIQSIPATRPSWRTNGNVAWFEFDGVDDRVSINPIGYASGSFGLCIGLSYLAYTPSTKYGSWRSLHIDGPYIGASHPTSVGDIHSVAAVAELDGEPASGSRHLLYAQLLKKRIATATGIPAAAFADNTWQFSGYSSPGSPPARVYGYVESEALIAANVAMVRLWMAKHTKGA